MLFRSEDVPQQEGYLAIDADFTRTEVERNLGVSTSGSVNLIKLGVSASANYSQKLRERGLGLNYIVMVYNIDHSKVFIPSARSEAWKQASKEEWLQSCGAGYVAAQDFGSMLIINFSLRLDEKQEEKDWEAAGSGNYLSLAKLKAGIKIGRAHV